MCGRIILNFFEEPLPPYQRSGCRSDWPQSPRRLATSRLPGCDYWRIWKTAALGCQGKQPSRLLDRPEAHLP